jgi:hypothetical protein
MWPFAVGWAALMLAAWVWAARHDYFLLALIFLISAFVGTYAIIIFTNGIWVTHLQFLASPLQSPGDIAT